MKKLTALVLTLSMLLSMLVMPIGATATEISEAERQEFLNAKSYDYLEFEKNRDVFAMWQEAADYGRFNQSADETTSTAVDSSKIDYT